MALIDFTLSNARRFYSSMGNPLGLKGLMCQPERHWLSKQRVFFFLWLAHWIIKAVFVKRYLPYCLLVFVPVFLKLSVSSCVFPHKVCKSCFFWTKRPIFLNRVCDRKEVPHPRSLFPFSRKLWISLEPHPHQTIHYSFAFSSAS